MLSVRGARVPTGHCSHCVTHSTQPMRRLQPPRGCRRYIKLSAVRPLVYANVRSRQSYGTHACACAFMCDVASHSPHTNFRSDATKSSQEMTRRSISSLPTAAAAHARTHRGLRRLTRAAHAAHRCPHGGARLLLASAAPSRRCSSRPPQHLGRRRSSAAATASSAWRRRRGRHRAEMSQPTATTLRRQRRLRPRDRSALHEDAALKLLVGWRPNWHAIGKRDEHSSTLRSEPHAAPLDRTQERPRIFDLALTIPVQSSTSIDHVPVRRLEDALRRAGGRIAGRWHLRRGRCRAGAVATARARRLDDRGVPSERHFAAVYLYKSGFHSPGGHAKRTDTPPAQVKGQIYHGSRGIQP